MRKGLYLFHSQGPWIHGLIAMFLIAACLLLPEWRLPSKIYRTMVVLDITQSMNTKDYHEIGFPEDRLSYAKKALREWLHALPCGSEVGLGVFTTQTVHFLFEPIEICHHFTVIDDSLEHIDWRMAWSADSHVEMGLYHAIRELQKMAPGVGLAFLTDGQETPPQTTIPQPDFGGQRFKGVILGFGGLSPVAVPRYDRENRLIGIWENADIEKPPLSTTVYSEKVEIRILPTEGPYLSWLDESHLKALSATTGLLYHRIDRPSDVMNSLMAEDQAEWRTAEKDLRPYLGGIALVELFVLLGIPGLRDGMSWIRGPLKKGSKKAVSWFFS